MKHLTQPSLVCSGKKPLISRKFKFISKVHDATYAPAAQREKTGRRHTGTLLSKASRGPAARPLQVQKKIKTGETSARHDVSSKCLIKRRGVGLRLRLRVRLPWPGKKGVSTAAAASCSCRVQDVPSRSRRRCVGKMQDDAMSPSSQNNFEAGQISTYCCTPRRVPDQETTRVGHHQWHPNKVNAWNTAPQKPPDQQQ